IPSLPELQERILRQVLRVFAIAGDEVQGLVETFVLVLDELVEAGPCLDAFGREPHDLTLRPHDPWMREPHRSSRRGREHAQGTRWCSCEPIFRHRSRREVLKKGGMPSPDFAPSSDGIWTS